MTKPEPRPRELLERIVAAEVRFVLVGALAVGSYGSVRATKDVDIVPDPDKENLERLIDVALELGGRVQVGERLLDPGAVSLFLRVGDRTPILTRLGLLDVLQGLPTIPRYDELIAEAEVADDEDLAVVVCSLRHLREMKRAADRPMDRIDLENLEVAHPEGPAAVDD